MRPRGKDSEAGQTQLVFPRQLQEWRDPKGFLGVAGGKALFCAALKLKVKGSKGGKSAELEWVG